MAYSGCLPAAAFCIAKDQQRNCCKKGGVQELIQLWINAPRANKWDKPFYQAADAEQMPKAIDQDGVQFRLASGDYNGHTGPIQNFTPVISMIGEIKAGREIELNAAPDYWTLLYVAKGKVVVNDQPVEKHHLVVFDKAAGRYLCGCYGRCAAPVP